MHRLDEARAREGARTAQLTDGVTAYHVHGHEGPWVVLVHGVLTPMYAWEPLARVLGAAGFRVLRYDQFGRGLSDRPRIDYSLPIYVRQLRELLESLGIERAHVAAWSFGGIVASRFASDYPSVVDRLVLIAPGLFLTPPPALARVLRFPRIAKWIIAARVDSVLAAMPLQHLDHPDAAYGARMREQLRAPGVRRSFASTMLHFPFHAGPEFARAGEHARPVLCVWGERDEVTPYANVAQLRALYPRAEVLTVDAKHAPHLARPQQVNGAIVRFLTRSDGA